MPPLSRRRFLGASGFAGALALGGPALLSACSSSSGSAAPSTSAGSSAAAADFGVLSLQFSWLNSLSFGPDYLWRAKGYDIDAGFTANDLIVGGPTVAAEPVVVTGKALFGNSEPDGLSAAITAGAALKVVAVKYQKSPYTVMSLAKNPITDPDQLRGKKIAVDDNNITLLGNLLKANGIAETEVTMVPANYDISLLSSEQVDGYVAYLPDEPVALELEGFDVVTMDFEDANLPSIGGLYVATTESIETARDKVAAGVATFIRGSQAFLASPEEAIALTDKAMGADAPTNPEYNPLAYEKYRALTVANDVASRGLLSLPPAQQEAVISTLSLSGVTLSAADMFDMSILDEVVAADPTLKDVPDAA